MTTQTTPLILTDVGKAERHLARQKLRAIRQAEAAKVQPSGTLHLLGVPMGFPPFIAAAMHVASAKRLQKEWIRIERNGMVWEQPVAKIEAVARQHWLLRQSVGTLSLSRDTEVRRDYVPGAVFSTQGET